MCMFPSLFLHFARLISIAGKVDSEIIMHVNALVNLLFHSVSK